MAFRFVGRVTGRPARPAGGLAGASTATTMVFARHARENPAMTSTAGLVILLANLIMVVRILAPLPVPFSPVVPSGGWLHPRRRPGGKSALACDWRQLRPGCATNP